MHHVFKREKETSLVLEWRGRKWGKMFCFLTGLLLGLRAREEEKVKYLARDKTSGRESSCAVAVGIQVKKMRNIKQHIKLLQQELSTPARE